MDDGVDEVNVIDVIDVIGVIDVIEIKIKNSDMKSDLLLRRIPAD